ncbi:hypothetical protein BaRGS_00011351, partial [Batillaria attramentaria]
CDDTGFGKNHSLDDTGCDKNHRGAVYCKEADLLDEFVIYNGYHLEATLPLLGWTPIFSQTSTVERCRVQCVVRSDCIAVNFDTGTQECEGVPKAALNLLNDLLQPFQSVPTAAFMPRLCN